MSTIEKVMASVTKTHGDERAQAAKYAAYRAWLLKKGA